MPAMAITVYALDGGGPKDSENTLILFLTKRDKDVFWQIGADMSLSMNNRYKMESTSANFGQQEEKQRSIKCQSSLSYKNRTSYQRNSKAEGCATVKVYILPT